MLDYSHAHYEEMSTSLLASQPVTDVRKAEPTDRDWDTLYSQLETGLASDKNWRYSWWSVWSRLAEYILPRRYHWLIAANQMSKGNYINDSIIDSTGTLAMLTCASGLLSGLTSPFKPWFEMESGLTEEDHDAQIWTEDTQSKIYEVLARSNFYTIMAQAFEDISVFGTAPVIIYEDYEDIIRLYLPCAGEYFLRSGARLDINTFSREFVLTVAQIVDQFGIKNCPNVVAGLWREGGGSINQEFVIGHTIAPNIEVPRDGELDDSFFAVPKKFKFKEIYWLRGIKTARPLSLRGFDNKPFMVARWSMTSNDPYGRGPGEVVLGDIKQLQRETFRKVECIDKMVNPPMGADVQLKNQPASAHPGSITYLDATSGKPGFYPLFQIQPTALTPMLADIEKVSTRIKDGFFVNIFMAITQMQGVQPRNELEISKRDLERLQALGPVISLFEQEFASPAIKRILEIMEKKGLVLPRPQSLAGKDLNFSYISIMRTAQQSAQSVSMKDMLATMGSMSSAAKAGGVPDPLRIINLDETTRVLARLSDFPNDCLYTDDEVKQKDEAMAQAMNSQKMEAQAPQLAMAGVNAAKTLSETRVPGGSALEAMMGGLGG